jgi:medium-chain acyl-[acyl-carrier-protein] hydrolase
MVTVIGRSTHYRTDVMHWNKDTAFFECKDTGGRASIRLFCFPYAGAGASCFKNWARFMPGSIALCCAQLRGREMRMREAPAHSILSIAEEAGKSMMAYLDRPFALFGHSMGALICYELARYLRRITGREPECLFISARSAPHIPRADPISYNLPEAEFLRSVEELKGTPPELFKHPELLELLLPALRADFEACQTYEWADIERLSCPITVFGGKEDEVTAEQLEAWRWHTSGPFQLHLLPGDHFYMRSEEKALIELISSKLSSVNHRPSKRGVGDGLQWSPTL